LSTKLKYFTTDFFQNIFFKGISPESLANGGGPLIVSAPLDTLEDNGWGEIPHTCPIVKWDPSMAEIGL
jgi:hypothetical protein